VTQPKQGHRVGDVCNLATRCLGRVKLLSAAGSAAVLFNAIKESWRLARKILSVVTVQVVLVSKCFLVLTVIREILTLLTILHLEIAKTFLLPAALSNLTRPWCRRTSPAISSVSQTSTHGSGYVVHRLSPSSTDRRVCQCPVTAPFLWPQTVYVEVSLTSSVTASSLLPTFKRHVNAILLDRS